MGIKNDDTAVAFIGAVAGEGFEQGVTGIRQALLHQLAEVRPRGNDVIAINQQNGCGGRIHGEGRLGLVYYYVVLYPYPTARRLVVLVLPSVSGVTVCF